MALLFMLVALDFLRCVILADSVFHGGRAAIVSYYNAATTPAAKPPSTRAEASAEAKRCDLWLRYGPGHGKGGDVERQLPVPHGYRSAKDASIVDWTRLPSTGSDMVALRVHEADRGALWWMGLREVASVVMAKDRCLFQLLTKHTWSAVRARARVGCACSLRWWHSFGLVAAAMRCRGLCKPAVA